MDILNVLVQNWLSEVWQLSSCDDDPDSEAKLSPVPPNCNVPGADRDAQPHPAAKLTATARHPAIRNPTLGRTANCRVLFTSTALA